MCVCPHTCKAHTIYFSGQEYNHKNYFFFHCLYGSYLDFKLGKMGREDGKENGKGKGTPFLCLTLPREEWEAAHSFSGLSRDLVAHKQFMQFSMCTEQGM